MKKTIIALLIVLTLIFAILCLKMSILEYFTETNKFDQIITNLEDKYDIKRLKKICKKEYDACINNEVARNTIIKLIDSEDLNALMFVTSPHELVSLRKCIIKNS